MIAILQEEELKTGDYVIYDDGFSQQKGRIKSFNDTLSSYACVVFNCNNDWDNYIDYAGQLTPIYLLKKIY